MVIRQTLGSCPASVNGVEPDACDRFCEVKTHDFWKPMRNLTDFVSPVLAAGRLFIRTPEELICYRVKK